MIALCTDKFLRTPLHEAAANGHSSLVSETRRRKERNTDAAVHEGGLSNLAFTCCLSVMNDVK